MIGFDSNDLKRAVVNNSPTLIALLVVWINLSNKITKLTVEVSTLKTTQAELVKSKDNYSSRINLLEMKQARIEGILGDAYLRENKQIEDENEI